MKIGDWRILFKSVNNNKTINKDFWSPTSRVQKTYVHNDTLIETNADMLIQRSGNTDWYCKKLHA